MNFEWDDHKEQINILKHGIDFSTALLVFSDEHRIDLYDDEHSIYDDRFISIGMINDILTVLFVVYTERTDSIRIISARCATKKEREAYFENYEF